MFELNRITINNKVIQNIQKCFKQGEFINKLISERQELKKLYRTQSDLQSGDLREITSSNIQKLADNLCLQTKGTLEDLLKTHNLIVSEISELGHFVENITTDYYQEVFNKESVQFGISGLFKTKNLSDFNQIVGFDFTLPNNI